MKKWIVPLFAKYKLLMWKNVLVIWRRKFQTVGEILIPVLFCAILVFLRATYTETFTDANQEEDVRYHELDVFQRPKDSFSFWNIWYAPKSRVTDETMKYVKACMDLDSINGFKTMQQLQDQLMTDEMYRPMVGVFFDVSQFNSRRRTRLNVTFRYEAELRYELVKNRKDAGLGMNWMTQTLAPPPTINGPRNAHFEDGGHPPGYYAQFFILLQACVSKAFLDQAYFNRTDFKLDYDDEIHIQRYSYPRVYVDTLLEFFRHVVPIIVSLSFLYPCVNNVEVRDRDFYNSRKFYTNIFS